ncbi:hypothetical protein [Pseudarthrobacter sp. NamB4]|uniref:hypothetical protein n=1 Tax=Pseudarthrobacter sp. NamB4 TaxID=2576837 RepID=UPI0010FD4CA6|nr:hypothetical protein [Pseudarthrobacter sp. NamB4]TLM71999.1 hypothetical protein FDW81_15155 [Pseudarthrobacter sp. NamB4]
MTKPRRSTRPRLPWATLAVTASTGIPLGILWWVLAPGGLNAITRDPALGAGTNPAVWLPRDLTLAGLLVLAGCILAVIVADTKHRDSRAQLVMALAGAFGGAVLAWQSGVLAAGLWGPAVDASANASIAFSLRAWPVLLLWPAATAVSVFALELFALLGKKPDAGGHQSQDAAAWPVK